MSSAGHAASLPFDSEPTVGAITSAYLEAAGGDALAALRLAVADSLETIAEMERRARQAERMVSQGFIRAGANASPRRAP
jgi:hypothetical protein